MPGGGKTRQRAASVIGDGQRHATITAPDRVDGNRAVVHGSEEINLLNMRHFSVFDCLFAGLARAWRPALRRFRLRL